MLVSQHESTPHIHGGIFCLWWNLHTLLDVDDISLTLTDIYSGTVLVQLHSNPEAVVCPGHRVIMAQKKLFKRWYARDYDHFQSSQYPILFYGQSPSPLNRILSLTIKGEMGAVHSQPVLEAEPDASIPQSSGSGEVHAHVHCSDNKCTETHDDTCREDEPEILQVSCDESSEH